MPHRSFNSAYRVSVPRGLFFLKLTPMVGLGMQIANVKQRQILPRMGNQIWASTPQNRTYRVWDPSGTMQIRWTKQLLKNA